MEKTPREELEHDIRNEFSTAIAIHYKKFPEQLKDPGMESVMKTLLALMMALIRLLNKFEVTRRTEARRTEDVR